eukprot:gene21128-7948_t
MASPAPDGVAPIVRKCTKFPFDITQLAPIGDSAAAFVEKDGCKK